MGDCRLNNQLSSLLENSLNFFIRSLCVLFQCFAKSLMNTTTNLDILPREIWDFVGKDPRVIDRTWRHLVWANDIVSQRNTMVVFTKSWCLVNNSGPIILRDIFVHKHAEGSILILMGSPS